MAPGPSKALGAPSLRDGFRPPRPEPRLIAIGLVGGVLSGLLGVGGGTIMVPFVVLAQPAAEATSLLKVPARMLLRLWRTREAAVQGA